MASLTLPLGLKSRWHTELTRGSAQGADAADGIYLAEVLPLVVSHLRRRREDMLLRLPFEARNCRRLISTLGLSPQTTIIMACLLQPEELVIIRSEDPSADVHEHKVREGLRRLATATAEGEPEQPWLAERFRSKCDTWIQSRRVDPITPSQTLEAVRSAIGGNNDLVDFTGGRKTMSAAALRAAMLKGALAVYLEAEEDLVLRLPIPGSEKVSVISPREDGSLAHELRDLAQKETKTTLVPAEAIDVLERSKEYQADPAPENLALALFRCYSDLVFFQNAANGASLGLAAAIQQARGTLADTSQLGEDLRTRITEQLQAFEAVATDLHMTGTPRTLATTAAFLALADRYRKLNRYDWAGLMYARAIEECAEQVVHKQYGLSRNNPEYTKLSDDHWGRLVKHAAAFEHPSERTWGGPGAGRSGPRLLYAAELLTIRLVAHPKIGDPTTLTNLKLNHRTIRNAITGRNHSPLAHGVTPLAEEACRALHDAAGVAILLLCDPDELKCLNTQREALGFVHLADIVHGMESSIAQSLVESQDE